MRGKVYGRLTVISTSLADCGEGSRQTFCMSECTCGEIVWGKAKALRSGNLKSCGCSRRANESLRGRVFGGLVAVSKCVIKLKNNKTTEGWFCECSCGEIIILARGSLVGGTSKSCGCLSRSLLNREDLRGRVYGRLTAVVPYSVKGRGNTHWMCECSCGEHIIVEYHSLIRGGSKSCGCIKREISRNPTLNPKYNPLLTAEDRIKRRLIPELVEWRAKVRARDNYTCQLCLGTKKGIIVHHINAYNTHRDQRTLMDNGISLCPECHKNFHAKYGRGNNTEAQFLEYVVSLLPKTIHI